MNDQIADDFFVPGMPDPGDADSFWLWLHGMLEDPFPHDTPNEEDDSWEIDIEIPY